MSITEDITPGPHPVQYWYNTFTGQVEEGQQSKITHLWGPYATREEAEKAMETACGVLMRHAKRPKRPWKQHRSVMKNGITRTSRFPRKSIRARLTACEAGSCAL